MRRAIKVRTEEGPRGQCRVRRFGCGKQRRLLLHFFLVLACSNPHDGWCRDDDDDDDNDHDGSGPHARRDHLFSARQCVQDILVAPRFQQHLACIYVRSL